MKFTQFQELYERHGEPSRTPHVWPFWELTEPKSLDHFVSTLLTVGKALDSNDVLDVARVTPCLQAYEAVIEAIHNYIVGSQYPDLCLDRIAKCLRRLKNQPSVENVNQLLARLDDRPEALTLLWRGAVLCRVLAQAAPEHPRSLWIKTKTSWKLVPDSENVWPAALAENPDGLENVAGEALRLVETETVRSDVLKPFRELKKKPTKRRLRGIVERDLGEVQVARHAIEYAIGKLDLVEGDLTAEDVRQIAESPKNIQAIAETVCQRVAYLTRNRGPEPDHAMSRYADQLCEIYEDLTGQKIGYSTVTENWKSRQRGERHGPRLEFPTGSIRG